VRSDHSRRVDHDFLGGPPIELPTEVPITFADSSGRLAGDGLGLILVSLDPPTSVTGPSAAYPEGRLLLDQLGTSNLAPLVSTPSNGKSLMEGTVKWFLEEKGYGFIEVSGNTDHFVHAKAVRPCWIPRPGDRVLFESASTNKGVRALNVHPSSPAGQGSDDTNRQPDFFRRLFKPLRSLFKRTSTHPREDLP
jgi:CspA family cold shock protein